MGKTCVLKDGAGSVKGYIQIIPQKVRCRINEPEVESELILFDEQGNSFRFLLGCTSSEQVFCTGDARLCGAVVVCRDALLQYTDESARRQYVHMCAQQAVKERKAIEEKPRNNETIRMEPCCEEKAEPIHSELPIWQQRRWPPPCCCSAEYVGGRWKEIEGSCLQEEAQEVL